MTPVFPKALDPLAPLLSKSINFFRSGGRPRSHQPLHYNQHFSFVAAAAAIEVEAADVVWNGRMDGRMGPGRGKGDNLTLHSIPRKYTLNVLAAILAIFTQLVNDTL